MFLSQLFEHLQGGRISCLVLLLPSLFVLRRQVVYLVCGTKDCPLKMVKQL